MKTNPLLLAVLGLLFTFSTAAQTLKPMAGLRPGLQKVLEAFPAGFAPLRGPVIARNPQSVEYACNLDLQGAEEMRILQHSGSRPVYSWSARLGSTEDFEEAAKKYRQLYSQLKGLTVRMNRDYTYRLEGKMEAPDESRGFSTSTFRLLPAASGLPNVKVELTLQFEFPEWQVHVLVYEREREDDEQGEREESGVGSKK